jgi:hypothetical protein
MPPMVRNTKVETLKSEKLKLFRVRSRFNCVGIELAADAESDRTCRRSMPLPPLIAKGLRIALIVLGALAITYAVVNIIAAVELLEPGDEEAFGLSRHWLIAQNALQIVLGAVMIFIGFRRRKS